MTELPDYGSPFMMTRRIAGGLRRKAAEYRKGDKPQSAEGCDEDADALEALLLAYQERGRALEALMDAEFARDWRTWSDERARLLLGVGPRYDAFMTARTTLSQKGDER